MRDSKKFKESEEDLLSQMVDCLDHLRHFHRRQAVLERREREEWRERRGGGG